jgi:hypothetical protein
MLAVHVPHTIIIRIVETILTSCQRAILGFLDVIDYFDGWIKTCWHENCKYAILTLSVTSAVNSVGQSVQKSFIPCKL